MGNIDIGGDASWLPIIHYPPIIYTRTLWSNEWAADATLRLVRMSVASAGQGSSIAVLARRYGSVKNPADSSFATQTRYATGVEPNYIPQWCKIDLSTHRPPSFAVTVVEGVITAVAVNYGGTGYSEAPDLTVYGEGSGAILAANLTDGVITSVTVTDGGSDYDASTWVVAESSQYATVFVGRWMNLADRLGGADPVLTGAEEFAFADGACILDRSAILGSIFWDAAVEKTCGWSPDFNRRDASGTLIGNRSAAEHGNCYLFGGTDTWTATQILDYLLTRWVDQSAGNPDWAVTGATAFLDAITDTFDVRPGETVGELLRRIVTPERGIDFVIDPAADGDGFEIRVFVLTGTQQTFGTATLPANADTCTLHLGTDWSVAQIEHSDDASYQYGTIRVIGERIVLCKTISGGDLIDGWDGDLETSYKAGTGTPDDPAAKHDQARTDDQFRDAYQRFVASAEVFQAPGFDDDGSLSDPQPDPLPEGQTVVRDTLRWIPLYAGCDYSQTPYVDNNPAGLTPGLLPPLVVIWDSSTLRYVPLDALNIGVHALRNEWGVQLSCDPNHRIALNDFAGAAATLKPPVYDWTTIQMTIAAQTDHRLSLSYLTGIDERGTLDIYVPGAECWVMAPDTVVGVSAADGSLVTGGAALRVLRNDNERLHWIMAAAKARYAARRDRIEVHVKGLYCYPGLVGRVITTIDQDGTNRTVDAPITAIQWTAGLGDAGRSDPGRAETLICAGFALR